MKVLLIGDYPPPAGGVAIHVQQLAHSLEQSGEEVSVLNIGVGSTVRTPLKFGRALIHQIRPRTVCHLHISGNNLKAWMVAIALGAIGRLLGARLVVTVHSGLFPKFIDASPRHRILVRLALLGMDRVIAVSEAVGQGLNQARLPAHKLRVVPAFLVDQVKPAPGPNAFIETRPRFSTLISMAHHPSPIYGQVILLNALAILRGKNPGWGLVAFGPGSQGAVFRQQVESRNLTEAVVGLGELSHAETLGVIAGSDVFVRPTLADGDSISVREALTLGVRCVASDVASRPEGTVLFKSENSNDLASGLERAMQTVPQHFPMPDVASILLKIYREIDSSRSSSKEAYATK